ncbi:uncharacterized protein LOC135387236 [Ornithodoros turicata]|uniref:uncharacterized protein LOC135387236 n=1 Tax=Ornithodoros turicata TaxID=34597 RepID=UPI003138D909
MGSPISTTVANLVMEFVEDKALEDAGQFITFYRRYVDDTFVIIKNNFTNTFFDKLNSIHPNIQFTCEEEKEKKIAFLDVLVQRDPCGNLKTSVYRKPCDTGQVLHYGSGHPLEHKRSVVRSLLSRAMKIPSDHQTRHEEITKAKADLRRKAYPEQFICDTYHRMMNTRPEQAESSQERPMYVTIPYLKGVSEPIRRVLSQVNIKTAFKPTTTLRNVLSHPKDRTPPEEERGVVYKVSCQDCPAVYIGETGRKTRTRMKEHKKDIEKSATNPTELCEHARKTGHVLDLDNPCILAKKNKWGVRRQLESWHIKKTKEAINRQPGPLPECYAPLLRKYPVTTRTASF